VRVMIARISSQHISTYWPTILTELTRLFTDQEIKDPQVLMEALKFVDMATIVMPDEFQVFKWVYIGDSVEQQYCNGLPQQQQSEILFKPFLELIASRASGIKAQEFHDKLNQVREHLKQKIQTNKSSSSTLHKELKRPIKVHRAGTSEFNTSILLANAVSSVEREAYLLRAEDCQDQYSKHAVDLLLEYEFVELSLDELEQLHAILHTNHFDNEETEHDEMGDEIDAAEAIPPVLSTETWICIDLVSQQAKDAKSPQTPRKASSAQAVEAQQSSPSDAASK